MNSPQTPLFHHHDFKRYLLCKSKGLRSATGDGVTERLRDWETERLRGKVIEIERESAKATAERLDVCRRKGPHKIIPCCLKNCRPDAARGDA